VEKPQRLHDLLYLYEDRYNAPKESFKFCLSVAEKSGRLKDECVIVDVGCAAGEFAYYLREQLPTAHIEGYEILPELVAKARSKVPGVSFFEGNLLNPHLISENHADVIFMSGVLSIFDNHEPVLENLVKWTKPGGLVLIFGLFNRHPVDVISRFRNVKGDNAWQSGWNVLSLATAHSALTRIPKVQRIGETPFEIGLDLAPQADDPLRSWTASLDGRRVILNGACLLHDYHALEIYL
jgi:SAM-dependent methyltransferase